MRKTEYTTAELSCGYEYIKSVQQSVMSLLLKEGVMIQ